MFGVIFCICIVVIFCIERVWCLCDIDVQVVVFYVMVGCECCVVVFVDDYVLFDYEVVICELCVYFEVLFDEQDCDIGCFDLF